MTDPAELPPIDHEAVAAFLAEPLPPMPEAPAVDWDALEADAARMADAAALLRAE